MKRLDPVCRRFRSVSVATGRASTDTRTTKILEIRSEGIVTAIMRGFRRDWIETGNRSGERLEIVRTIVAYFDCCLRKWAFSRVGTRCFFELG